MLLSLFFLWRVQFVQDLQPDFQGFDLMTQFEESLMNFTFQMSLDSFLGIVNGLDGATNETNLE